MRGKRTITREEEFGFICDVCGQDHVCDICEDCYNKIQKYIESVLGGKIRVDDKNAFRPNVPSF
mgnify:CR=1 FL=1